MRVTLAKGVKSTQGGAETASEVEKKVRVPDIYSFFRVKSVTGLIARNKEGDPEQVLMIETTSAAKPEDIARGLRVSLLPKKKSEDDEEKQWSSPQEIDEAVLQQATELPVKLIPSERRTRQHTASRSASNRTGSSSSRCAKARLRSEDSCWVSNTGGDFPCRSCRGRLPSRGHGGVLALSGERKLSIKSRGVREIEYEIARVPADQINHLVSQTRRGVSESGIRELSISTRKTSRAFATERQSIAVENRFKANYSAFDFSGALRACERWWQRVARIVLSQSARMASKPEADKRRTNEEEEENEEKEGRPGPRGAVHTCHRPRDDREGERRRRTRCLHRVNQDRAIRSAASRSRCWRRTVCLS